MVFIYLGIVPVIFPLGRTKAIQLKGGPIFSALVQSPADNGIAVDSFCVVYNACSLFDGWIDRFHVYKVETIGDSYMVASGVPYTIPDHAGEMARLALELRNSVEDFKIPHLDEALHLRVGLHSGDVQLDQFPAIF